MGAETLLHLRDGVGNLRIDIERSVPANVGETVHLRCKPGQTHLFGARSLMTENTDTRGMGPVTARTLEFGIIGVCLLGLFFVFQPISKTLFGVGAVVVVIGGLIFNLVPLCTPNRQARSVVTGAGIVAAVFFVVVLLALGSAGLYGVYIESRAP